MMLHHQTWFLHLFKGYIVHSVEFIPMITGLATYLNNELMRDLEIKNWKKLRRHIIKLGFSFIICNTKEIIFYKINQLIILIYFVEN